MSKDRLVQMYVEQGLSTAQIATRFRCSQHKVNYWLAKHKIKKRTISEAIYKKWNPKGDPFVVLKPRSISDAILYGIGIGLYWGEGTKSNRNSVRLGNSNPFLLKKFIEFLVRFYSIDKDRLRFGLQIFGDLDQNTVMNYWTKELQIAKKQFYPTIVITPHRGIGNYRVKTKFGVVTLYFNNKKLRDIICQAVDDQSTLLPM